MAARSPRRTPRPGAAKPIHRQVRASGDRGLPLPGDGSQENVVIGLRGEVDGSGGTGRSLSPRAPGARRPLVRARRPGSRSAELHLVENLMTAALEEEGCLLQIAPSAGDPLELDEGGFDLRVTADRLDAVRSEDLAHQISGPGADLQEQVRPGRYGRGRRPPGRGGRGSTARDPIPGRNQRRGAPCRPNAVLR